MSKIARSESVGCITLLILGIGTLLTSGCSALLGGPTQTPVVLYVTATLPPTDTPNPFGTATPLFGPTVDAGSPTFIPLPTLPPATATDVPSIAASLTPSFTPEFTDTPTPKVSPVAAQACGSLPPNGFTTIFQHDRTVQAALGCPQSPAVTIGSAVEPFEHGTLIWASALADQPVKVIYALYANGTYQRFNDTWQDGVDPANTGENPPPNRKAPIRGFGKVWHTNPTVRTGLGWALADETGTNGEIQRFAHGEMLYVASANQTYLFANGTWQANPTHF